MELTKLNWTESKNNLVLNWQQATMAKAMIEKQIALCNQELAKFPEDKPVENTAVKG